MSNGTDRVVDFSNGPIIKVHSSQLNELKQIAKSNPKNKRYRLCMHDSPDNALQEMLICVTKDDYSRPHKHVGISESHHIIEGSERIILFDEEGGIIDSFILDWDSGYISYRINSSVYHMSVPITDTVIKLEVKVGPFSPDSNIFPEWAPDGNNSDETRKYINDTIESVKQLGF